MTPLLGYHPPCLPAGGTLAPAEPEIVELALLLPRWQAQELERAACEHGLTPAQLLRRMIGSALAARLEPGE